MKTSPHQRPPATTASLLARVDSSCRDRWSRQYRTLLRLRDRLARQTAAQMAAVAKPLEHSAIHLADRASDQTEHNIALAELSVDGNLLYEVEEALRRIEIGSYGVCEITGKRIPTNRLQAIPWTRFAAEAELVLESGRKF